MRDALMRDSFVLDMHTKCMFICVSLGRNMKGGLKSLVILALDTGKVNATSGVRSNPRILAMVDRGQLPFAFAEVVLVV